MRRYSKKSKKVYKSRPKGKKAIVRRALGQAWKRSVAKVCKRVMSRNMELKHQNDEFSLACQCLMPTTTSIAGNYWIMTPSNSLQGYTITNGTANNQMIGNKINIKRLTVTGVLTPSPYNITTNAIPRPQFVRIYFYRYKQKPLAEPDPADLCNSATCNFFENGGTSIGFIGRLLDTVKRLNNDSYTYLTHRTYKIGLKDGYYSSNATLGNTAYANNDFKYATTFKVDLSKYIKVARKDDDGTWTTPNIIMLIQPVAADDSQYLANISLPCQIDAQVDLTYTDA